MTPHSLPLGGQTLDLLPDRAAFWREQSAVLVADCHFGKSASLRRHGLPVPEGGTLDDIERLDALLAGTGARRLIVVGDLFHAPSGYAPAVIDDLVAWRRRQAAVRITLVTGNHDRALHRLPRDLDLEIVDGEDAADGLRFVHDPGEIAGESGGERENPAAHVCGHLHPAIRLGSGRMRRVTAPCFWLQRGRVLVLPSFGSFTGSAAIVPGRGDRVFALAGGRVIEVPAALLGTGPPTRGK